MRRLRDYYTCIRDSEYELVEKKSRFIAHCICVRDCGEAEEAIAAFRKRFWDARHNCYAFRTQGTERSSDDGEPAGTAGIPILNVLRTGNVMNVLIVVTRYFGGILLGTGGLARAYSKAASEALKMSGVQWIRSCREMRSEIAYSDYGLLERFFRDSGIRMEAAFSDTVGITCYVPEEDVSKVEKRIVELTEGRTRMRMGKEAMIAYPADLGPLRKEE